MSVELTAPASLFLGITPYAQSVAALSLTIKYPLTQLTARPAADLYVSGARAPVAYAAAQRYRQAHALPGAEIEIEVAAPSLMGLGSDTVAGWCAARAVAALQPRATAAPELARDLGLGPEAAPEVWGLEQGGLLLTDVRAPLTTPPLRRQTLTQPDDRSWAVVLYLPRPADDVPASWEADRRAALIAAAPHLPAALEALVREQLWPAAQGDDFAGFTRALAALHTANEAALSASGQARTLPPDAQAMLDVMRREGLTAAGPCLTGLAVYGFIQGAFPSIDLRKKMMARLGHEHGTIMATIVANTGLQQTAA